MKSSFTIDTKNGGWNMPNGTDQMGPLAVDSRKLQAQLAAFDRMLDQMVIDAARNVPLTQNDKENYKEQLTDYVRERIHGQLSLVRKYTIKHARSGYVTSKVDRGAASTAIFRRSYQDEIGGNINIAGNNKRMSSKRRPWEPGKIKKRDHTSRTATINRYYGLDRAFILRILEAGRDSYMAESGTGATGRGSKATWGRRGAMAARGFFTDMTGAMNHSADIIARSVERYIERNFK